MFEILCAAELCEHWRYDDLPQSTRYSILASLHKGAQALPADYPSQLCSYVALSETPNRSIEERGKAIEAVARLSGATGKEGFKQSLITILDRCLSSSAGFRLPSCPCEEGFDDVAAAKPAQLYSALVRGIGELPLADIRKLLLLNHDGNVRRAYLLTQAAKHGMVGSEELVRLRTWCSHSLARDDSLAVACALVASLIMTNPSQSAKEEWLLESTREIGRSPAPTNGKHLHLQALESLFFWVKSPFDSTQPRRSWRPWPRDWGPLGMRRSLTSRFRVGEGRRQPWMHCKRFPVACWPRCAFTLSAGILLHQRGWRQPWTLLKRLGGTVAHLSSAWLSMRAADHFLWRTCGDTLRLWNGLRASKTPCMKHPRATNECFLVNRQSETVISLVRLFVFQGSTPTK